MKLLILKKYCLAIVILCLIGPPAVYAGLKTDTLERKINEISILRAKIIDKIDQAVEMRYHLEERLTDLSAEIRSEQMRAQVYSHPAAIQNLRIRYNLSLIQTLRAYINLLNERIDYFQTGNERLKFLNDQINDDLAMIDILKDMEIKNLVDRIDIVMNEFVPETDKKTIDADHIRILPIDYIWEEISLKKIE